MPAQHPLHPKESRIGIRAVAFGGLTAAALSVSLALPSPASASPDTDEEFDRVSAELKDTKSELSDLTDDQEEATESYEQAQRVIDDAPKSIDDVLSTVDVSGSAVDRLSTLTGYSNTQTDALSHAIDQQAVAKKQLDRLNDAIAESSAKVDELGAERDELRDEIAQQDEPSASSSGEDDPNVSSNGAGAVEFAEQQLGDPYVFGATGPDSWDCSSLTQAAWQAAGEDIGRDTYAQWDNVSHISGDDLQAGDLVFYNSQGHVALYVGDGKVIHAPTSGDVVRYGDVDMMPVDGYARP